MDHCSDFKNSKKEEIFKDLLSMCGHIMKSDKERMNSYLKLIKDLLESGPEFMTQEHLVSIPLILAKILVLRYVKEIELDEASMLSLFKIFIEEADRRSNKEMKCETQVFRMLVENDSVFEQYLVEEEHESMDIDQDS